MKGRTMKSCVLMAALVAAVSVRAATRHAGNPVYPTYDGRVMAGYQGWFHNPSGGTMYKDPSKICLDMWPDVSEYEKTYPTGLRLSNGETARFFCSDDGTIRPVTQTRRERQPFWKGK